MTAASATERSKRHRAKQLSLRTAQAKRVEDLEAALREIATYSEVYTTSVFKEPNLDAVTALLKEHGMLVQMDRMHASWARYTLANVSAYAIQALEGSAKP